MNWSLIIFTYNEAGGLPDLVKKCNDFLEHHASKNEIILVNDGSSDNTEVEVNQLTEQYPNLIAIHHSTNKGIGMALKSGYARAQYDYVCAVPGDGQFHPQELIVVQPFLNNQFYSFYRLKTHYSFYRGCLTHLNRIFNRVFLGISLKDVNWIKVYRREQLDFVKIELNSSLLESEICAKLVKAGCRPIENPSVYYMREFGKAKGGSWKTLRKVLQEMWLAFIVVSSFNKPIDKLTPLQVTAESPDLMVPLKKNY